MIHQGSKIKQVAYEKGLKQKDLARLKNVSESNVSWELKQEKLSHDTLKGYAEILNVNVEDLMKENLKQNSSLSEDYLTKYLKAVEKIDFLQTVLLKNGIRVDMPNFKPGVGYVSFAH